MLSKERPMTNALSLSQDSTLPQLSIALDSEAMKHVFQNHIAGHGKDSQPIIDR